MTDKRKTPTSKLLIAGIILVAVIVVFGIIGFLFRSSDSIKITKQENVYGISGKIINVRGSSILIETPVIPYEGSNPLPQDRWIWEVSINENTVIVNSQEHKDEDISDTEEGNTPNSAQEAITINELKAGNLVVITSATDIKKQFSFDDKYMTASKIEVF